MADWPADKVERWPLDRLIPYARNARTHSEEQVAQIAASIREFGFTNPVLIDEAGGIIAGHGRVLAARKLGIADVPVMSAIGWTEAQKRAYVIADNKLTENAGWDKELLRLEVADLAEMGFDLPLMGFSEAELASLAASANPRPYRSRRGPRPSGDAGQPSRRPLDLRRPPGALRRRHRDKRH